METTRAVRIHRTGGPEVLQVERVERKPPGPGEVCLRVRAIGLNRAEAVYRSGIHLTQPVLPSGLGYEAAGIVESVGPGVKGLCPGDAASLIPSTDMVRWPTYAEHVNYPARWVVRHPKRLSWQQAAATWMAYLTAWAALCDAVPLARGDAVLVTAASSSVGLAAIQLARRMGAVPIALTRTPAKARALCEAGAAEVIVWAREDVGSRVAALTGGRGVRAVLDAVGGPGVTQLARCLAPGGTLIAYGLLSPQPTPFPLLEAIQRSLAMRGLLYAEVVADAAKLERATSFILAGLERGEFSPRIARAFAFEDIVQAHRYLESNDQFGKVVITLGD